MTASKIEWTDRSDWNPIRGCTRVSPGCGGPGPHGGCYAEAIAARFSDPGQAFHGFAERTSQGGRWTGKVALVEDRVTLPLRWKKPAKIFVSSTSDVFHESLRDADIDRLFAVMALCPQHTFQVLTKRPARMRAYFTGEGFDPVPVGRLQRIQDAAYLIAATASGQWNESAGQSARKACIDALHRIDERTKAGFRNVWLGVSVEDQQRADERIPDLLATPAAVRFISAEPLLGPIDLSTIPWDVCGYRMFGALPDRSEPDDFRFASHEMQGIRWVITGGESGPGARPMHPDWARSLRDQCQAAGVAFHFKQWGEWAPFDECPPHARGWRIIDDVGFALLGKRRAGRLLDGRTHDKFPA